MIAIAMLLMGQLPFDIPAARSDAARHLLKACLVTEASDWMQQTQLGADDALAGATKQCWVLRKDVRAALGPVAEAHLRKEGITSYGEDVVDLLVDRMFDTVIEDANQSVLAALKGAKP